MCSSSSCSGLTGRCKLAAIARLSRVFRPLPPHAFLHDNINETLWGAVH